MLSAYLFSLALVGLVQAQSQNQSVNLYIPADNPNNILAVSVISANKDEAVYQVACVSGAPTAKATILGKRQQQSSARAGPTSDTASPRPRSSASAEEECGLPTPLTVTQGPSTVKYGYALETVSLGVDCKLTSSAGKLQQAVCAGTQTIQGETESGIETATLAGSDLPEGVAVRITAGAEKLTALAANTTTTTTSATTSATGSSSSSGSSSGSGSGTITSGPTSGSKTSSAPVSTTSSGERMVVPGPLRIAMVVLGVGMALLML